MTKYTTNALDGKTLKMHKWQNKLNTENKHIKVTMALLNFRTEHMVEMITANDPTPHTVVTTTKTNVHEMIAADQPQEIAPIPTRAVRAAQVITTGMVQHSTMKKRNIRSHTTTPRFTQHHRKSSNTRPITQPQHHSSKEQENTKNIKRKDKIIKPIKRPGHCKKTNMKLGNGILKTSIQSLSDENFHFYNSLVLTDDLIFQRTHFWITPPNIPRIYNHDAASDDNDDLPLQHQSNLQNKNPLKIAILIAKNTCTNETSHAIIDSGASCCVTLYIEDFITQPTSIQNTTLK
jgi:hypothetical protein